MKFSIITVTYNAAETLEKAILSVKNQTYKNFEHIIIDGMSSDNTLMQINKYLYSQICYISEPDKGIFDAMNKGVTKATGDYIYFLNADDSFYSSDVLNMVALHIEENQYPDILYGHVYKIVESGRKYLYKKELLNRLLCKGQMPSHQSMFFKSGLFKTTGFFKIQYQSASDLDFVIRCAKANIIAVYVNAPIAVFSLSGVSNSGVQGSIESMQLIKKYYGLWWYVLSVFRYIPILLFRTIASKLGFLKFYRQKIYPLWQNKTEHE